MEIVLVRYGVLHEVNSDVAGWVDVAGCKHPSCRVAAWARKDLCTFLIRKDIEIH